MDEMDWMEGEGRPAPVSVHEPHSNAPHYSFGNGSSGRGKNDSFKSDKITCA